MNGDFLARGDAPFGPDVWKRIDDTVVGAATSQLSARRLLEIDGPYGLGLKSIPGSDRPTGSGEGAVMGFSPTMPVSTIQAEFAIPVRDIANFESTGIPFDTSAVARAALDCARQEDDLIFNGSKEMGLAGLLSADNVASVSLTQWAEPGDAFENILQAVNALDQAGLHGPYSLALAPALFNGLHRRYPQGSMTEMMHVAQLVTGGIVKAPAISAGGVLVAVGKQYVSIVIGQDLMTGFIGPEAGQLTFFVMESLALRIANPSAVCVIK
ncbi:MAG: bacteriocin family protein [Armatimonadetes bacterium]|jgi:uncharacterized linocin/CFP29 family protein|nr:bacteriocin family protein [Armatimonadota bacterium]MDI9583138.1 family 1 encapsulin nanocompartment shell protein [Acidobacteriota bacterium]